MCSHPQSYKSKGTMFFGTIAPINLQLLLFYLSRFCR